MLMNEYNVIHNLTLRKRYQNFNLVGHEKMITCMDVSKGLIVTGSKDNMVKVWDIQRKKA